jgi:hypothetical protein
MSFFYNNEKIGYQATRFEGGEEYISFVYSEAPEYLIEEAMHVEDKSFRELVDPSMEEMLDGD